MRVVQIAMRRFPVLCTVAGILVLLLATLGAGQVSQERTHTIRQSGSGAPVVSVTSDDASVQSRRQVTHQDDAVRTQRDVQEAHAAGDGTTNNVEVVRVAPRDRNPSPDRSSTGDDSFASFVERREAMAPDILGSGSSDRTPREQERSVEERRQPRRDGAVDGRDRVRSAGRQDIVIQQRGQASGEDASLVQQIFITADALLGGTGLQARSAATGSDVSSGIDAILRGNALRGDAAVDAGATARDGRAATDKQITTRSGDGRVTVRSREAASGSDAVVSDRIGVRQRDGRVRVVEDRRQPRRTDRTGCFSHTHEHGNGRHHGSTHIGTHTHAHTHCPGDAGRTEQERSVEERQSAPAGCVTHTHEHGNERHHGSFHIGTHTHSHTHC